MSRRTETIAPDFFDGLYTEREDPWGFRSSAYEQSKYADTLAVLDRQAYRSALEIGCSIGVFTRMLAARCTRLLAIDASSVALETARRHSSDLGHVTFAQRMVPAEFPRGSYDLILLSEVVYYLTKRDVAVVAARCCDCLEQDGEIVLCHWLGDTDYPLTGDEAAETFVEAIETSHWRHQTFRRKSYRLDHLRG